MLLNRRPTKILVSLDNLLNQQRNRNRQEIFNRPTVVRSRIAEKCFSFLRHLKYLLDSFLDRRPIDIGVTQAAVIDRFIPRNLARLDRLGEASTFF